MKLNLITSAIALAICALIAYAFYSFSDNPNKAILATGSMLLLGISLLVAIGAQYNRYPAGINSRVVSVLFFVTVLLSHIVFSFLDFTIPAYVVTHGILFLLYLLMLYFIMRRNIY